MQAVDSSCVARIGYDPAVEEVYVEFHDTGLYAYEGVSARVHEEFDRRVEGHLRQRGKDNGAPGLRPQYHPGYYGAFVLDPDGNNVEAVCHRAS